jgi:hypothetical protein
VGGVGIIVAGMALFEFYKIEVKSKKEDFTYFCGLVRIYKL